MKDSAPWRDSEWNNLTVGTSRVCLMPVKACVQELRVKIRLFICVTFYVFLAWCA